MPFQRLALDHFGPTIRSRQGNRWLLVIVDIYSKYIWLQACRTGKALEVTKFLEEGVFLKYSVPELILSDNARALVGRAMNRLLTHYNVRHWTTAYYHSQGNPTERYIRTVSAAIRSFVFDKRGNQRCWDENLAQIQLAMNVTINDTTQKSPFYIAFGREHILSGHEYPNIRTELDRINMTDDQVRQKFDRIREEVNQAVSQAIVKRRERYNRNTRPIIFSEGERVFRPNKTLSNFANVFSYKLAPKYIPCRVIEKIGGNTYVVQDEDNETQTKVHANDLHKDRPERH